MFQSRSRRSAPNKSNFKGLNNLQKIVHLDPSVSFQNNYNAADTRIIIRGLSPTRGARECRIPG